MPDVDAPDAADVRLTGEGVAVESADGYQLTPIEMTAENFSARVEAILSALPIFYQRIEEIVPFASGFSAQLLNAGDGQLYFFDCDHGLA